MRRTSLLLVLLLPLLVSTPAWAGGTGPGDVASALQSDPVYVAPDAEAEIGEDEVRAQIRRSDLPVYVAVLPQRAVRALGGRRQLNSAIGQRLGNNAVLFTVAGGTVTGGAGSGVGLGTGQADAIAQSVRGGDLTQSLVQAVARVQQAAGAGAGGSGNVGGGTGGGGTATGGNGGGGFAVLAVLALLGLGSFALYRRSSHKRSAVEMQGSRADVTSLYDRLGADVATLHPGDDPVAAQALADAAERYNATGALLSQADTPGEYDAARRTVAEGLAATRLARTRLGLDPGPDVPPPPGAAAPSAPRLGAQEAVRVGNQEYLGSPVYAPGRQHYWGGGMVGGTMVPGGWYGVPWGSLLMGGLVGSALSGGLGHGGGYAAGYEEGIEDAGDLLRGSGGFGGAGDWGGGGGDWGGSGDWGGGGGGGDGTW